MNFAGTSSSQESPWQLRFGVVGTGTFDEGIWTFKPSTGLGTQVFEFSNSWGVALDADYQIIDRLSIGAHISLAHTGFQITIDDGTSVTTTSDNTSHNQMVGEIKYVGGVGKRFRPFIGWNTGVLITKDIELTIQGSSQEFTFINPLIFGAVFGFDWEIGEKGWGAHTVIRAQSFEYTLEETSLTPEQRLLDQVWWMNYNHVQIGVSKRL